MTISLPAVGIRSTDEFWDEFSSRFAPSLVEQVVLAGRESQGAALAQRLNDGVSRLPYAADSPDEVVAFAVAAIRRAEPVTRLFLEARAVIVDTEEAARQLAGRIGLFSYLEPKAVLWRVSWHSTARLSLVLGLTKSDRITSCCFVLRVPS